MAGKRIGALTRRLEADDELRCSSTASESVGALRETPVFDERELPALTTGSRLLRAAEAGVLPSSFAAVQNRPEQA